MLFHLAALEKKLREIDTLKRKRDDKGLRALEPAQRAKIERETELRAQLDSIGASNGDASQMVCQKRHQATSAASLSSPKFEVGSYLLIDGLHAKVRKLSEDGQVRVQFSDSGQKEWLQPASEAHAKRISKIGDEGGAGITDHGTTSAAIPSVAGRAAFFQRPPPAHRGLWNPPAAPSAPPMRPPSPATTRTTTAISTTGAVCTHCPSWPRAPCLPVRARRRRAHAALRKHHTRGAVLRPLLCGALAPC